MHNSGLICKLILSQKITRFIDWMKRAQLNLFNHFPVETNNLKPVSFQISISV